jgi:photosystem II stability/assembly factor-like uncharacterized protein
VQFAGSLTVDPQDLSTVYIATLVYLSDPCVQNKNCLVGQVFKSTDGGMSWSPASTGLPAVDALIRSLVIDPQNSRTLYAAANTYTGGNSTGSIFKSTDRGASWSAVNSGGPIQLLVMDPQNHNTIYAVTTSGLLRSTDAGGTWTLASSSLPATYVNSLVIDPRNTNIFYAVSAGLNPSDGVFKSVDGGNNWAATAFPSGWSASASILVLDPQNSSIVYAASNTGVFKSTGGGSTWSPSSSGLGGVDVSSFALDSQNAGTIFALTDLGFVKTSDGGASWSPLNDGLTKTNSCTGCGSLVIDPKSPRTLYEGVSGNLGFSYQGGHVLKSTDAGGTWSVVGDASFTAANSTLPLGGYFWFSGGLAIDPQNSKTLYALGLTPQQIRTPGYGSYIFKSTDGGENWTPIAVPLGNDVRFLAVDPQNSSTLYAGPSLSKSTDGGSTWSAGSWPGVPPVPPEAEPQDCDDYWVPVTSVAVDPANSNNVYGTGSGGVFSSDDAGANWQTLDSGLRAYACSPNNCFEPYSTGSVAIDPRNSTIYVTFGGGVFKSIDRGKIWTPLNTGLPAGRYPAGSSSGGGQLAIDPTNPSRLYLNLGGGGIYTITLDH